MTRRPASHCPTPLEPRPRAPLQRWWARGWRCALLPLLLTLSTAAAAGSQPLPLSGGGQLHQERTGGVGFEFNFFWARLPHNRFEVRDLRLASDAAALYRELCPDATLVTSAGFWGYRPSGAPMPLGLVIENGHRRSPPSRWPGGGALIWQQGEARIVPYETLRGPLEAEQAIQSMPLLIWEGEALTFSDPRSSQRLAVALSDQGELVVAGVVAPWGTGMSLEGFAQRLLELPAQGGPRIRYALALDGGGSVHLHLPSHGLQLGDGRSEYVPNALCFYPIDPPSPPARPAAADDPEPVAEEPGTPPPQ